VSAVSLPVPNVETTSEETAKAFLVDLCREKGGLVCPRCRIETVYSLKSGRKRCGGCGYTFHDFTGRRLNNCRLSAVQWLSVVGMFLQEETTDDMAKEMGLSYNTVYKAVTTIREAILANALDAPQLLPLMNGKGGGDDREFLERHPDESLVFGVVERNTLAFVDVIPEFGLETLRHFNLSFMLKTTKRGGLVYTDPFRHYKTLLCCTAGVRKAARFNTVDSVDVDDEAQGFWAFAVPRLFKYRGVTPRRFPLYIKELEWRYNNRRRENELWELLCLLAGFVEETG
jgi:transposase